MEVGDKVYLEPTGNAARRNNKVIETTISKVGRKYFEVEEYWMGRFFIDSMIQDNGQYVSNYQAYMSLKEIHDKNEAIKLHKLIRDKYFDYGRTTLTLEVLEKIKEIIDDSNH